jgi:hypothetical protein
MHATARRWHASARELQCDVFEANNGDQDNSEAQAEQKVLEVNIIMDVSTVHNLYTRKIRTT